jgi:hypothetical protein
VIQAPSASVLYGYQNEGSTFGFYRMAVDATGVTVQDSTLGVIQGAGVGIRSAGGLIYTTTGQQIDPGVFPTTPPTVLGTFDGVDPLKGASNLVVADASLGRVFYLTPTNPDLGIWTLSAYSMSTRQLLASLPINNMTNDPSSLIRYGARGLAFRTAEGYVFLVESPDLIP